MMDSGMISHQPSARASQMLNSPPGRRLSSFLRSWRSCGMFDATSGQQRCWVWEQRHSSAASRCLKLKVPGRRAGT